MTLETLDPDFDDAADDVDASDSPDADELDPAVLDALGSHDYRFKVWGGDWCGDCQRQLPAFGAALDAAGVPDDRIEEFPVTKGPDGKEGEGVEEYGIELIPTVVVVTPDGEEVARFVEEADVSIAEFLARELAGVDVRA
ncbi:thioredoxin family protein [Halorubrum sp. CSM-61]|uniref:TlpA family protein disulfide reductase n=1 Tax=Halorubrum sp. CSM-61 TaxID=2485838 RepID=UPI000F4D1E88|nr:thioredoxin family protein [Halorubrum sp. CSM-61]